MLLDRDRINTSRNKKTRELPILLALIHSSATTLKRIGISPSSIHILSLLFALFSYYFLTFYSTYHIAMALLSISLYRVTGSIGEELATLYDKKEGRSFMEEHYFALLKKRVAPQLMPFFLSFGLFYYHGSIGFILLGFAATILLSSFPHMMASQVLLQRIAKDRESIVTPTLKRILSLWREEVSPVDSFSLLFLLIITLFFDLLYLFSTISFYHLSFRLLLLVWLVFFSLYYRVIEARKWMGYFETL